MNELILGGARSGKSALAEQRAAESGLAVTYIATGEAGDDEMAARIAHHKARRPSHWGLVEAPLHLANALREHAAPDRVLLVDCVTLWLSNLLFRGKAAEQAEAGGPIDCPLLTGEMTALLDSLQQLPGRVILVSNEVGLGIVPMGATTRLYMDEAGRLNQRIAQACERVTFVAAGLPLELKTPVTVRIAVAEAADIPALCTLLNILFSQEAEFTSDVEAQQRGLARIIENPDIGTILLARHEDRIVGMVNLLYTVSTALGESVALLEDMVVLPAARGSGVGSLLLREAIAFAGAQGCKRITLLTDHDNESAQRFYRQHGFALSAMIPLRLSLDA